MPLQVALARCCELADLESTLKPGFGNSNMMSVKESLTLTRSNRFIWLPTPFSFIYDALTDICLQRSRQQPPRASQISFRHHVMSCPRLPEELWKLILVHVDYRERLGNCSRVSRKLNRAATAATEQLELQLQRNPQRSAGLLQWMRRNGHHVSKLLLAGIAADFTDLPCKHLRSLVVRDGAVQLGPSSNHPGVLHSCSGLTQLCLGSCTLLDGPNSLSAVSAVPALQFLKLCSTNSNSPVDGKLTLPGSTLQVLTQLTYISFGLRQTQCVDITAESLQHISALQHLQALDLTRPSVPLSPSSTPGLKQLTALQGLLLDTAILDAAGLDTAAGVGSGGSRVVWSQQCCRAAVSHWPAAAAAASAAPGRPAV